MAKLRPLTLAERKKWREVIDLGRDEFNADDMTRALDRIDELEKAADVAIEALDKDTARLNELLAKIAPENVHGEFGTE